MQLFMAHERDIEDVGQRMEPRLRAHVPYAVSSRAVSVERWCNEMCASIEAAAHQVLHVLHASAAERQNDLEIVRAFIARRRSRQETQQHRSEIGRASRREEARAAESAGDV